jgi:hypothetical protein
MMLIDCEAFIEIEYTYTPMGVYGNVCMSTDPLDGAVKKAVNLRENV